MSGRNYNDYKRHFGGTAFMSAKTPAVLPTIALHY